MGDQNITSVEVLFLLLILVFAVPTTQMAFSVSASMEKMKTLYAKEYIEAHKHGFEWNRLQDFWLSIAAAFACYFEQSLIYKLVQPTLYKLCKEKNDENMRIIKTNKASEKSYQCLYFICTNTYGYYVLSQTEYLPFMMGGRQSNDMKDMYSDFPCVHKGNYMKSLQQYYLITLGYHIYQLYRVFYLYLKGEIKNDWAEMTLHHLLTIGLYVFSYMMGFVKIGSLIMFLHDWVDIWSPFTKIWVETKYDKLTVLGAVMTWSIWVYSRLIVFPQIVYYGVLVYPIQMLYPNYQTDLNDKAKYDNFNFFVMSLGLFLTFLIILHIYWIHMLTGAILKFAFKGKVHDPQERTEEWQSKINKMKKA